MEDLDGLKPPRLAQALPSSSYSRRWRIKALSKGLSGTLDRVQVLGDDNTGHTGCINALSWAKDGEILLSGGDDTTVRIWRIDPNDTSTNYPYACQSVIKTGHKGNIFNAQMLPFSSRIATVAADKTVRVFDIGEISATPMRAGRETSYSMQESNIRILRCHAARTKRIVTEDSPDLFLTVAEDGTVRQNDLRTPHTCSSGLCPSPLVKLPHDLSTLALSPLTPYQFVVAGESPYGYLFDRRQTGRILREEWGVPPCMGDFTTCVRRFGRKSRAQGERRGEEHITGARMAASNGHEVLLSYSGDGVYLFSTRDEPGSENHFSNSILPTNEATKITRETTDFVSAATSGNILPDEGMESLAQDAMNQPMGEIDSEHSDDRETDDDESDEDEEMAWHRDTGTTEIVHSEVPLIFPMAKFVGHCNSETVKDVNFLGPQDEYVASGSDDGNFFIWQKSSGKLQGIYEGDGSVVNVIENHPRLPLLAVSGIDTTVKLFAPVYGESSFSRMARADSIVKINATAAPRTTRRLNLAHFLLHYDHFVRGSGDDSDGTSASECANQ